MNACFCFSSRLEPRDTVVTSIDGATGNGTVSTEIVQPLLSSSEPPATTQKPSQSQQQQQQNQASSSTTASNPRDSLDLKGKPEHMIAQHLCHQIREMWCGYSMLLIRYSLALWSRSKWQRKEAKSARSSMADFAAFHCVATHCTALQNWDDMTTVIYYLSICAIDAEKRSQEPNRDKKATLALASALVI